MLKASHANAHYQLQDEIATTLHYKIEHLQDQIEGIKKDIQAYDAIPKQVDEKGKAVFPSIELEGKVYTSKEDAGKALIESCRHAIEKDYTNTTVIGSYQGFVLKAGYDPLNKAFSAVLEGAEKHITSLGTSESGNFTRLDNLLNSMPERLERSEQQLENLKHQLEEAKEQLKAPFPHEEELAAKSKRLEELTKILESAADEPTVAEIVDPYYIQVNSESAIEKLKESGITFEKQEKDGIIAIKVNRSDTDKVHNILDNAKVSAMKL